ncbi:MAG: hypothetical protein ABI795_06550, partial [Chthoniobacterales bacterium]
MAFSRANAFGYLRRAHTQGRLAHAYLITGPPGSGKRALAADLTQLTNGADADAVFTSSPAGVYVAEPESKSRRILIDQIRQLEQALQFRAVAGRKKLAIVVDADRLQPQAANAFLKTLEEPPRDSLLLLLSTLPEALPDTVLSRCVTIPLSPVPVATPSSEEQELIELLATVAHENAGGVQLAYRLAQGFQRLLAHARNAIQEEASESLKREETRYKNTTDGAWLDDRDQHYKAFAESVYVQRRATLIETLLLWWGEVLRAKTGIERSELPAARAVTAAISERLTAPEILRRIRRVEDLRDQLGRNIQEALAIEVAFLRI